MPKSLSRCTHPKPTITVLRNTQTSPLWYDTCQELCCWGLSQRADWCWRWQWQLCWTHQHWLLMLVLQQGRTLAWKYHGGEVEVWPQLETYLNCIGSDLCLWGHDYPCWLAGQRYKNLALTHMWLLHYSVSGLPILWLKLRAYGILNPLSGVQLFHLRLTALTVLTLIMTLIISEQ